MLIGNEMHPSTIIPQSPCLTIQQFFGKTYLVPPFQRGYAWQESQIKQLLDDFRDFLRSDEPVYLLGQVIVASSVTEVDFELIDGQQRATSILLILIAVYTGGLKKSLKLHAINVVNFYKLNYIN
jgi:uncharacterized protein with ParB-like and HNH nuclease domain